MLKKISLASIFCIMTTTSPITLANDQEQMMQSLMQMQRCMTDNVEASYLQSMTESAGAMSAQVKQLCEKDQRQQAQEIAINFAKKTQTDPNFKAMQKCMADMGDALPNAPAMQSDFDLDELSKNNVCDEL